ncbi:MAG TPA: phenylalanine--tRNA ligase subunit alpha [Candidatus Bathyarchaeota archaeon]|nr:phenylalanine--tRNA ligase subunit alpha [Candidatus Bathyarchaeota archaeon]HEW89864.1 phenylalanine--tRNA ligase subunit alpha [Candidatus Bathyarchaeota archaeon]
MEVSPREWDILKALEELGGEANAEDLAERAGLPLATLMSDARSLADRGLLRISELVAKRAMLTEEGRRYAERGLPERRLVEALGRLGGEAEIGRAAEEAGLSRQELAIALGWARRRGWVSVEHGVLRLLEAPTVMPEEEALKMLLKGEASVGELIEKGLKGALELLEKRGLIELVEETKRLIRITELGLEVLRGPRPEELVSHLTPELIVSGRWRSVRFKRFNLEAPGPPVYPGRMHPVQEVVQEIREIFLEMGFQEIRGPLVETAFWNFDALFTPQDHPAREMHDTFYLADPSEGGLPAPELVRAVARTHEDGWETGSTGWGYKWSADEARRLVMRTHTTATTIRYLAEHPDPPVWVFCVDRVYRNERVDYKHLAEFHQIEGIVMDVGVGLRDLMGILSEFYRKLGFKKVRFWPSYFPYTEPSLQSTVYSPELRAWIELCGAGIFRPEVVRPLGVKHPVLAWGGGLERLVMLKLGVKDIRVLYRNDLGWLRGLPICP